MSEAATRSAIYDTMKSVADVGLVHDYDRWAADWNKFIDLFKINIGGVDQIRGWEILQKAPVNEDRTSIKRRTYSIKGYMSINDSLATEKTFSALIDAIAAKFRESQSLGGALNGHNFIQVETLEPRMFGSILCHFAELTLTVYEFIA